jgi:gamma-glutamyltranspeptidase/glutathione hydrolase
MVVTEHPLATAAGVRILEEGGNAADAAVAAALALAVVYPQAGNLGGGGFAVYVPHEVGGEAVALDFREAAPAGLTREHFLEDGVPVPRRSLDTVLGCGVPGSPAGLWRLHKRCGRLPFEAVARPAIDLARQGFRVDAWLARDLRAPRSRERLLASPGAAALFYPGGEPLAEGALLVQADLARTLRRLVREGPDGFYRGAVARLMEETVLAQGGVLTRADLAAYHAVEREPLRGWFRGREVVTMPPPSSGGVALLQVLRILDGFPLDEEQALARAAPEVESEEAGRDDATGLSGRAVHWWIEAMRRAFADRAEHLGDPDFHDVPLAELLAPEWIAARRVSIGERCTPDIGPLPAPAAEKGGETTHLSVLDEEGNAVSLTTTLNTSFGCGVMVEGAGFLLNNELDDFAIHAGTPNAYGLVGGLANALEPGKRPLSSMTPAVVRNGGNAVTAVIGSPGGPRIITAVIQVLLRTEVYGQDLRAAVAAPRVHQQWNPARTFVEDDFPPLILQRLRDRGHELEVSPRRLGSVQAIQLEIGGEPVGASDPRRGGNVGATDRPATRPARPPE